MPFKGKTVARTKCNDCKHYHACRYTIIACVHFKLMDDKIEDLIKGTN